MDLAGLAPWAVLIAALFFFLWLDLHFFARGREPSFKEAAWWSVGWLVLGLAAALAVWAYEGSEDAVLYTTVYLIERSLSLDNLFVFLLLFAYFGVPYERRPRLLFWGIVAALALRGAFIIGGTALIEQFHVVIYLLGVGLLVLAYRIFRGVGDNVDPDKNLMVRLVRRDLPGDRRVPRGSLVRQGEGAALRHAAVPLPGGDRVRRHRVRDRLDPGRVRDHHRPPADLDGQRVRAAGPARAVRARGEPDRPLPLPRRDDRGRARPGGREAADRGHREDRSRAEPRPASPWRSRSASRSRSAPTAATRTPRRSARSGWST